MGLGARSAQRNSKSETGETPATKGRTVFSHLIDAKMTEGVGQGQRAGREDV